VISHYVTVSRKTGRFRWNSWRFAHQLLDRLRRMRSSALILALAMGMTQLSSLALSQQFEPITKLTTWYTDRTPIDVEIVASKGQGNEAHLLQPERKTPFPASRRAYVSVVFTKGAATVQQCDDVVRHADRFAERTLQSAPRTS